MEETPVMPPRQATEPEAEMPVRTPTPPGTPSAEAPTSDPVEPDASPAHEDRPAVDIPVHMDEDFDPDPVPDATMPDTLVLKNKNVGRGGKGKELDPKHFDDVEWAAFAGDGGADGEQWEAHIKNGAVRVLSLEEAATVPPERILPVPRNKAKEPKSLRAKSQWAVPGHLAPKSDGTRTNAPVAPQLCLYILFSIAVLMGWQVATFDVGDAFLTCMETMSRLYVCPPREGIRGVPQNTPVELVKEVRSERITQTLVVEASSDSDRLRLGRTDLRDGDVHAARGGRHAVRHARGARGRRHPGWQRQEVRTWRRRARCEG